MNGLRREKQKSLTEMGRSMLMSRMMVLGSMVLSMLMLVSNGLADEGKMLGPETRMKVSGVVSKVQDDRITVKTSWGQMSISASSGPSNLKVGEEVEMQVNEGNIVIDVHRKGEPSHGHRFVVGKLIYAGKTKDQIKLWTPEGEQVFPLERMGGWRRFHARIERLASRAAPGDRCAGNPGSVRYCWSAGTRN